MSEFSVLDRRGHLSLGRKVVPGKSAGGEHLVRRLEMRLAVVHEPGRPVPPHHLLRQLAHARVAGAERDDPELDLRRRVDLRRHVAERAHERLAREHGRRRHRDGVAFGLVPLLDHDLLAALLQGALDDGLRRRELVDHHARARRLLLEHLLDARAMRPRQQAVDVPNLEIEAIVGRIPDLHDRKPLRTQNRADHRAHAQQHEVVRDQLAVPHAAVVHVLHVARIVPLHAQRAQLLREVLVHMAARDDERTEIVALARFVAAAVRRAKTRRGRTSRRRRGDRPGGRDGTAAPHRDGDDALRLEEEFYEILRLLALNAEFAEPVLLLRVQRAVEAVALHRGQRIGDLPGAVVADGQQGEQLLLLRPVELERVACFLRSRHEN